MIFAAWAAKGGVGPAAQKHLLSVFAQTQGLVTIHQHKAEHHLDVQQAVPGDKFHYRLFHFCLRLCALAGGNIALAVFRCFQLVMIVPHPMGTGLFKQILHHTRPFSLIVPIIRGGFSFFAIGFVLQLDHGILTLHPCDFRELFQKLAFPQGQAFFRFAAQIVIHLTLQFLVDGFPQFVDIAVRLCIS